MGDVLTIAIDPGQKGGIAWAMRDMPPEAHAMPETATDVYEFLSRLRRRTWADPRVVIEKIDKPMRRNGRHSVATFYRHLGELRGIVIALEWPLVEVDAKDWQRLLGALPAKYEERKAAVLKLMQMRYPHLGVTACTADALGILTWAIEGDTKRSLRAQAAAVLDMVEGHGA